MLWRGQWMLASHASPEPQTLSLQDLVAKGPGDNWHLRVTHFTFGQGYVVEKESASWGEVWIPVYPSPGIEGKGSGPPPSGPFSALVHTRNLRDENDLARFCESPTVIQGVMTRDQGGPPSWSVIGGKLLAMYPGTDLEKCRVINEGDVPWPSSSLNAIFIAWVVLLGVGEALILLLGILKSRHRRVAAGT